MTKPASITVSGVPEAVHAFKQVEHDLKDAAEPSRQAAVIVAEAARFLAPVRTGFLANSYDTQDQYVVSHADYAYFIEYGVPAYGMPALFVVGTAAEQSEEQILDVFEAWEDQVAENAGFQESII